MPTRKRRLRPRNIILATLVVLAALIGYQVYAALTARPGAAVDYSLEIESIAAAQQASISGADAWPILLDIIARTAAAEDSVWTRGAGTGPAIDYTVFTAPRVKPSYDDTYSWDEVEARAGEALAAVKAAGVFDRLAEMAAAPRAVRPIPHGGRLLDIMLPELGKMRNLARVCRARMYLASASGDEREFARAFEQALALGRVCCQQPFLIDHLVGIAIVSLATGGARDALTERPFSPETCREMLAAMDRQLPLQPLGYAYEGERIGIHDMIQWTHTDDGRGSGRLILSTVLRANGGIATLTGGASGASWLDRISEFKIVNLAALAYPSKAATSRKTDWFFDQLIAQSRLSVPDRRAATFQPDDWVSALPARQLLLRLVLPANAKAMQSRDQVESHIAGTRVMLALEVYKELAGRYPESLDALVPTVLPAMPRDPYTGKPLGYRLLKPGELPPAPVGRTNDPPLPQPPRAYLLYSFGADAADNGGTPAAPEYNALRLPSGRGTDFIMNVLSSRPAINPPPPPPPPPPTPADPS